MSWKPGEKLSVARMKRLSASSPSSYTVYKDGTTIRGETNKPDGTHYSGTSASTIIQAAMDAT